MSPGELNPGIRRSVAWLRDNGFVTIDSRDLGRRLQDISEEDARLIALLLPH